MFFSCFISKQNINNDESLFQQSWYLFYNIITVIYIHIIRELAIVGVRADFSDSPQLCCFGFTICFLFFSVRILKEWKKMDSFVFFISIQILDSEREEKQKKFICIYYFVFFFGRMKLKESHSRPDSKTGFFYFPSLYHMRKPVFLRMCSVCICERKKPVWKPV